MEAKDFQYQRLLSEYNTLREELLQIYQRQHLLIFGSTLTTVAMILVKSLEPKTKFLFLPLFLLLLLIAICVESISNFDRIFRIGSYLAIFHETNGISIDSFKTSIVNAAWHANWRKAIRYKLIPSFETGTGGCKSEAIFLTALGSGGFIFLAASDFIDLIRKALITYPLINLYYFLPFLIYLIICQILFLIFIFCIIQLWDSHNISIKYEEGFLSLINKYR